MTEVLIIGVFGALILYVSYNYIDFKGPLETSFHIISKGVVVVFSPTLSDSEKELKVKKVAFTLISKSLEILLKIAIILIGFSLGPITIFMTNIGEINEAFFLIFSWEYLLFTVFCLVLFSKIPAKPSLINGKIDNSYSTVSKSFHRIFMLPTLLKVLGGFDDFLYFLKKRKIQDEPIFIIGLPRCGSTALLNALYSIPDFGTYTYRNMPFITSPFISNLGLYLTKRKIKKFDRAHGDGHRIDLNSPEAFEEILWKLYFPSIFKKKQIDKISRPMITEEFKLFFTNQTSKISEISVKKKRRHNVQKEIRYISKNNANISRLEAIKEIYPDAIFLAPLRSPIEHANSLLNQHLIFLDLQQKTPFVLEYMNDLGHFEFGANHKPLTIDDPKLLDGDIKTLNYWLEYWIIVYKYLEKSNLSVKYIAIDDLIYRQSDTMQNILTACNSNHVWKDSNQYFKASTSNIMLSPAVNNQLVEEAERVYNSLLNKKLN